MNAEERAGKNLSINERASIIIALLLRHDDVSRDIVLLQLQAAFEEGRKASELEGIKNVFDCRRHMKEKFEDGYKEGQREMRERTMEVAWDAQKDVHNNSDRKHQAGEIWLHISELPLTSRGGEKQ